MAVIYEDFIRCSCGCADYKEEKTLTFNKSLLPRDSKLVQLPAMAYEYRYLCTGCNKELQL